MNSLKAWTQDPEDWKVKPSIGQPSRRKTFRQKLVPWLVAIAIPLAVMLINWGIEKVCGG